MSGLRTQRRTTVNAKIFAVVAVLIMALSAFAVINAGSSEAGDFDYENTCLDVDVVYHLYYGSRPSIDVANNASTADNTTKSITYYGTVVSTEYNPQVWEFSEERWFTISNYVEGSTVVFTGWVFATSGTVTDGNFTASSVTSTVYDPGDVVLYKYFKKATQE